MSIRFGVIGCGGITRFHFPGLTQAGAQITWVADLDEDLAQTRAEEHGARYTTNYQEVIQSGEVDAVLVATTGPTHRPICLAAIEAGLNVICEKTLGNNSDEALEIVQAAQAKGVILYTSYMKRFIPAVQKAKALMPRLGKVFSAYLRSYQPWGSVWEPPSTSRPGGEASGFRQRYGGGILHMGGSHMLDLVCFFLGRPKRVYGKIYTPEWLDYDLLASALLETDNGVVHFEAAGHPLRRIGFLRDGWDERLEINGTRGRLDLYSSTWDNVDSKASLLRHYDNETGHVSEYRYDPTSPFARADAFFVANMEQGVQGEQPITTGYDVDELIAHIHRSAETGEALEVNWRI